MTDARTFGVGGTWTFGSPPDGALLSEVGRRFQPNDDSFCFWVDAEDPLLLEMSWDESAASFEHAARQCRQWLDQLLPLLGDSARLSEIVVSTDDEFWRTSTPDEDVPSAGPG